MLAIPIIMMFPTFPITVIITVLLYTTQLSVKYLSLFCIIGVMSILFIFNDYAIAFIIESKTIFKLVLENLFDNKYIEALEQYQNYSFFSWLIMILISISISAYINSKINENRIIEQAGIKPLLDIIKNLKGENKKLNTHKNDEQKTLIGATKSKKPVYCADNAKHIFVAGTTGSGKTVLLSNFIKQGISNDYGTLIIDGKGDMGQGSILNITLKLSKQYNKKLYVINMNDPYKSDKYNPFNGANITIAKDMLINMSNWSEEHYKLNTERYLQRLLKMLTLQGEQLTFQKIIDYISPDNFGELSARLAKEEVIIKQEHLSNMDLIKSSGKIAENAAARFFNIAESEIGEIFDENGIDIYTVLEQGAIILFILNPLIYPELSPALGRLILIDAKKAVSKMFDKGNERKFFIFDEINSYSSSSLVDLINKSRSAGVTCICATQSLADLEMSEGEAFKHQVIENCNNYVILRQNSFKSAEECAMLIGTSEKMEMTYQMKETESTGVGSARKVREFIHHPDDIKNLQTGNGIFVSRDYKICEKVLINKPF